MVNPCVKCYTSVCCSVFYLVIGIWGIIFLGILSILFGLHKQGNIGHFSNTDEQNCQAMYIAVILYFVLTIAYVIILRYRLNHPFPSEEQALEDEDDFGPVPAQPDVSITASKEETK